MNQFLNIIDIIEYNQTIQIIQNIYISSYGWFGIIKQYIFYKSIIYKNIFSQWVEYSPQIACTPNSKRLQAQP